MKIAPIDIAHKSFARKMMGFDPEEVMDFLRGVSSELESIIRERNNLKENLREKELQINEFRERDELLKHTITTATRMSEKIQKDAERESRLILNDANQKADLIVSDARDSLRRIYQEISDLKRVRMQFENNMKALIHSHLTMLDQGHQIMPSPDADEETPSVTQRQQSARNEVSEQEIAAKVSQAINNTNRDLDIL